MSNVAGKVEPQLERAAQHPASRRRRHQLDFIHVRRRRRHHMRLRKANPHLDVVDQDKGFVAVHCVANAPIFRLRQAQLGIHGRRTPRTPGAVYGGRCAVVVLYSFVDEW